MKKIMFNDKCGLTEAVLEGRKTMTRRIVPPGVVFLCERGMLFMAIGNAKYKPGEVVAVAQSYKSIRKEMLDGHHNYFDDAYEPFHCGNFISGPGYHNKMFVRADLMPHQICITNVRVERLQDISDEDFIREGIKEVPFTQYSWTDNEKMALFDTPRDAFAALIDKVSGNGTWESNPWVFVYGFELVK